MIDHHHVEPDRRRPRQCLERLGPAIDGDRQPLALRRQHLQRVAARAIALHQPVRDIVVGIGTGFAEVADQHRRTGRAVDVIIAEHHDRLPRPNSLHNACDCIIHTLENRGIGQPVPDRRRPQPVEVGKISTARQV